MDFRPLIPSFQQGVLITTSGLLLYGLLRVIYNVYFHPLARFPGPRSAACTSLWLAYMQLIKGVSLSTLRADLHQKYGDIIRIAPNELHFSRPSAYNEIYSGQNKWDKDWGFYRAFDMDQSFFTQTDYNKWKYRRGLVSNLFSKRSVLDLQHVIRARLDHFCDVLKEHHAAGKSSNLYLGFQCWSADTITSFLFSTSFNQLSYPDFHGNLIEGVDIAMPTLTLAKFSAVIVWFIHNTPHWVLRITSPRMNGLVTFRETIQAQIKSVMKNPDQLNDAPHRILYSELLNPEASKGHSMPTAIHLRHEAQLLFAAGSHTVGTTLMIGSYHLLRNPDAKQRLVDEVRTAWPVIDQPPPYEDLEKLPFLSAAIKESLRLASPTPAGLPRVVPSSGAVISGVRIPGGTVVSQSVLFVSQSEEVFPQPYKFLPDRWLQPDSKALENWFVTFSKGPRSCLGINLAYCELYLAFAYLFRRFDVREDLTRPADLTWSEHFLPVYEGQHLHAYCQPRQE